MRSLKSLLMVVVALVLVSCSMAAKPEKNETEKVSAQGEVIVLNKADFLSKVYNYEKNQTQWVYEGNKPAIIDFYADWCGPCKKIAPDVEALAEEYKDQVIIGKCDVDDNDELTGKFGVRNIPTVLFIKDGEVKDKTVGAVTKAQLEEKIKALL